MFIPLVARRSWRILAPSFPYIRIRLRGTFMYLSKVNNRIRSGSNIMSPAATSTKPKCHITLSLYVEMRVFSSSCTFFLFLCVLLHYFYLLALDQTEHTSVPLFSEPLSVNIHLFAITLFRQSSQSRCQPLSHSQSTGPPFW